MATYNVNGTPFDSFMAAVAHAQKENALVVQTDNGLVRWRPAPPPKVRKRHVIVNADGSETEFSRIKR